MDGTHDIALRPFAPRDLAQCTDVEQAVYGSGAYSTYFFRQLHDLNPALVWIAEDRRTGKIVGHLCAAIGQGGEVGWILNTAVLAHYRRQGIGRLLLERGVAELRAAQVRRMLVTSEPENVAAIRLYERLGFRAVRTEADYYGDGYERLILECDIEGE
ncbi:MAG: GNAT family N-acetyltransferase [Anaerolineae bacterium]|nr:GNAT family N-acetyltransferase [Anaerolineae bacterium]